MALSIVIVWAARWPWLPGAVGVSLTYLMHASLWALGALIWTKRKGAPSAVHCFSWKAALFGPLVSTMCASLVSCHARAVGALPPSQAHTLTSSIDMQPLDRALSVLAGLVVALLAVGALRIFASALILGRRLRSRRAVIDPRVTQRLERLRRKSVVRRVHLSESEHVPGPMVIGTREIAVPAKLLARLTDAEVDAVIAHELAHLERWEGVWFPLVAVIESVLWMQPLNRWAAARFRQSAEWACDDRAVELTGDAHGLAQALLHVAELAFPMATARILPTMALSTSTVLPRVRRLTAPADEGFGRAHANLAAAGCASVGLMIASVGVRSTGGVGLFADAESGTHQVANAISSTVSDGELVELARREARLQHELESAHLSRASRADDARALELEQEARHLRDTRAWLEQRLVGSAITPAPR